MVPGSEAVGCVPELGGSWSLSGLGVCPMVAELPVPCAIIDFLASASSL